MSSFGALRCDFCDGGLIIDDSREFAVCEFCGTKYMASTLRAKIQEIKGTVKVEGAVETTVGKTENDRLLKNARALYNIGEVKKALIAYKEINDKFPECKEGWIDSLEIVVNEGCCLGVSTYYGQKSIDLTHSLKEVIAEINRLCRILTRLTNNNFSVDSYRNKFFENICNGNIYLITSLLFKISEFANILQNFLTPQQTQYIISQGKTNASLINAFHQNINYTKYYILKEYIDENAFSDKDYLYDFCHLFIGKMIFISSWQHWGSTDSDSDRLGVGAIAKKCANTTELQNKLQKQNQLQIERKEKGLCPYCGDSFKGMFSKVCSHCGHPKDYQFSRKNKRKLIF